MIRLVLSLYSLFFVNNLYSADVVSNCCNIENHIPKFKLIDVTYKYEIFRDNQDLLYCEGEISMKFYIEGASSISVRKSKPYQQLDGKRIVWSLGRIYDLPQGKDTINISFPSVNPGTFFRVDYYNPDSGYYEPISDSIYSTNYILQNDLALLEQSNLSSIINDKCTLSIDEYSIIVNNPSMEYININILNTNGILETSIKTNEHNTTIDKSRLPKGIHLILIKRRNNIILTQKIQI